MLLGGLPGRSRSLADAASQVGDFLVCKPVHDWDSGDRVVRRELLATLFANTHISNGRWWATRRALIGRRKSRE